MDNNKNKVIDVPTSVTPTDKLETIFRHKGPYSTVYLSTMPLLPESSTNVFQRWQELRKELEVQGATQAALDAIEARITLPVPEDTAAICVIAAADGSTVVDYAMEPPRKDLAIVDTLPYAAPLLEWQQRRVPHLVVTIDAAGGDIVSFGLDNFSDITTYEQPPEELIDPISEHVKALGAKLVVLAGSPEHIVLIADKLVMKVPFDCRIITDSADKTVAGLSEATVRYVTDTAVRKTVDLLDEQRFLAEHDAAVDGLADTVDALNEQRAEVLLIHDDPTDTRRLWVGVNSYGLSIEEKPDYPISARAIDALITSALLQEVAIRIIPSTGDEGPDDDIAVLTR